jgi:hypothetical protein
VIHPYYHAPDISEGSGRMRGSDDQTSGMFSYLSPEQRVRQDHPLRAIRRMTDEVLTSLSPRFSKMYSDMSRPSIPPDQLLPRCCRRRSTRSGVSAADGRDRLQPPMGVEEHHNP